MKENKPVELNLRHFKMYDRISLKSRIKTFFIRFFILPFIKPHFGIDIGQENYCVAEIKKYKDIIYIMNIHVLEKRSGDIPNVVK